MPHVVFTGAGTHPRTGAQILRDHWYAMARHLGWNVQDKIDHNTTFLVASRFDTVKAKRARALGVEIMEYRDFFRRAEGAGVSVGDPETRTPVFPPRSA